MKDNLQHYVKLRDGSLRRRYPKPYRNKAERKAWKRWRRLSREGLV